MPLVIPPGFAHVAVQLRHDLDPDPWYVTWGVDTSDASGDHESIGRRCQRALHTGFSDTMSSDLNITGCDVTVGQDGAEPIRLFVAAPEELSGVATDDRLPQNCALLVRKNTALGGRRNRGRLFFPGILAEDAVSAVGVISPAAAATYQVYAGEFFFELTEVVVSADVSCPMVLLHNTGISATPAPTPVTSLTVDNVISTQRRRLR